MIIYRSIAQICVSALLPVCLSLTAMPGIAQTAAASDDTTSSAVAVAKTGHESPRYLLMGTNGRAVRAEDFRERFQLIAFGFVSCPDICPTTLLEMQQVLVALGDQAKHLQPIFITVDPQRDTLEVLKAYTANFDKRILGLTGSAELIRFAADNFKVEYTKVQEPGAEHNVYTMDHTAGMFLLGPDGQYLKKFAYRTPTQDIIAQIKNWIDENSRLELNKPKP